MGASLHCLSHRWRTTYASKPRRLISSLSLTRACRVANGRGRQVQPNAGAAGFLRGTVAAENACRAHNEARTTERKARGKARSKARQAIDMVWGKARHSTALGLGTHTRDRRQRESPILKTAGVPLPHPHQRALPIRHRRHSGTGGSAPLAGVCRQ